MGTKFFFSKTVVPNPTMEPHDETKTFTTPTRLPDLATDILQKILDQDTLVERHCPATALLLVHCGDRQLARKILYCTRTLIICPNEARRPHPIGTLSWSRLPWRNIERLAFHCEVNEREVLYTAHLLSPQRLVLLVQLSLTCEQYLQSLARFDLKNYSHKTKFIHLRPILDKALPQLKTLELTFNFHEDFSAARALCHPLIFPASVSALKLSSEWSSDNGNHELLNMIFLHSIFDHDGLQECRISQDLNLERPLCSSLGTVRWMPDNKWKASFMRLIFETSKPSSNYARRHMSRIIDRSSTCPFKVTIESVSSMWYFSSFVELQQESKDREFTTPCVWCFDGSMPLITVDFIKSMQKVLPYIDSLNVKQMRFARHDCSHLLISFNDFLYLRYLSLKLSFLRVSSGDLNYLPGNLSSLHLKVINCQDQNESHPVIVWTLPSTCTKISVQCEKSLEIIRLTIPAHSFNSCASHLRQLTIVNAELKVDPKKALNAFTALECLTFTSIFDYPDMCEYLGLLELKRVSLPALQTLVIDNACSFLIKQLEISTTARLRLCLTSRLHGMKCRASVFSQLHPNLCYVTILNASLDILKKSSRKSSRYSLLEMFPSLEILNISSASKRKFRGHEGVLAKLFLLTLTRRECAYLKEIHLHNFNENECQRFKEMCQSDEVVQTNAIITERLIIHTDKIHINFPAEYWNNIHIPEIIVTDEPTNPMEFEHY